MKGKIYKITNLVNGKIYIGQTIVPIEQRFQKHCWGTSDKDSYHKNMAIKQAIRKYGKNNFRIDLVENCDISQLDEREIYWINYYDSYNNGYNCTLGGQKTARKQYKLSEKEESQVLNLRRQRYTLKQIAELFNVDKTTISNICKRHNVKIESVRNLSNRIDLEKFKYLIEDKKMKCMDIAKILGISRSSVINYAKSHNLNLANDINSRFHNRLESKINNIAFIEFLKTKPALKTIAKHFHISRNSVRKYINFHHIEYNFPKSVPTLTGNAEG